MKADVVEKETRLDHLQKKNDKLNDLLKKAKEDAVAEFKTSKQFTDLLDTNYATGFEDFRMDAVENFPNIDFSSIKLNLSGAPTSSLLQMSSEDVNVEDDATTQPLQDELSCNLRVFRRWSSTLYTLVFSFFVISRTKVMLLL